MARYQILYWQHIPLGVKGSDIEGTVRVNLPASFQEMFRHFALQGRKSGEEAYTTSGFRWEQEQEREGSAAQVAAAIVTELVATWNPAEAWHHFQQQISEQALVFVNLQELAE